MAVSPEICDFGAKAPQFTLPATDGRTYALFDIAGPKGTLILFICNHCPYVTSTIERVIGDAKQLMAEGIGVAAICSNDAATYPADSFDKMQDFAAQHAFPFPYLHDADQTVARAFGAVCTPDPFGYNADLELQYRGRIDEYRRDPRPEGGRSEIVDAMRQIAATGEGPREQTPSMGCSIKWRKDTAA